MAFRKPGIRSRGQPPGAKYLLSKPAETPAPTLEEPEVPPTATEALAPDPADGRRDAAHKAVLNAGLERGLVSAESATAELMLESVAKAAHRADPDASYEQHYVRALDRYPELAALLD